MTDPVEAKLSIFNTLLGGFNGSRCVKGGKMSNSHDDVPKLCK
jgi:hypothetical protein